MINKKEIDKLITKTVEKLKKEYQPQKIVLFGSFAWGTPTKDSDLDLLIIKETNARHIDRSIEVCRIIDDINQQIALEPLVYTPQEIKRRLELGDDFIRNILNKGNILYG